MGSSSQPKVQPGAGWLRTAQHPLFRLQDAPIELVPCTASASAGSTGGRSSLVLQGGPLPWAEPQT